MNVFLDAIVTAFTPVTGLFNAAKWNRYGTNRARVEDDHACLKLTGESQRTPQRAGVGVSDESVLGLIGASNDFFLARK